MLNFIENGTDPVRNAHQGSRRMNDSIRSRFAGSPRPPRQGVG
jgi:hypothetical protein